MDTFTTEGILFSIIEPKLIKIVHNQYEKEMLINLVRVEDIAIITEQAIMTAGMK